MLRRKERREEAREAKWRECKRKDRINENTVDA